ncbi:uncharacterized protein LOC144644633 isoform X2 [Oculina patagonica]
MRGALLVLLTIVSVACAAVTFSSKRNKRGELDYGSVQKRNSDASENQYQSKSREKREDGDGSTDSQPIKQENDASDTTGMAMSIGQKALEKQLEIMGEQQQKAGEFVDKKLDINIEPDKGWKTEDMFVPPGFHIDAEITGEDEKPDGEIGDQAFTYPMGVGGLIMNGCFGKNYQPGDPCYQATWKTTICLNLIDGAAFIGVGFDGRGDYSPESRKMSIVQRDCSGRATYDDFDVPDTMNVHGVYDTSATMQTFFSRTEYQTFLQQQAGMAGSAFGFYAGVKKAWGSSSLSGSQQYMALYSIDIDRYEIYLDEVKPSDLSVNFLQEFMDLPVSYLAPGAAVKFQDFILRWGTHYIKSGKFGGRLQIFKTMEGNQVSSKAEFSQVMEAEFRSLFASFHAKSENKEGSSQKQQSKSSSTSIAVEGGDEKIASIISDMNSPTIKNEMKQWLESIRTFPKPFKFMVAPITDLLKFNPSSLFADEERDWGCEAHTADMKKDPDTGESYYEVEVNGTLTRKNCAYKDRDDLVYRIERRRAGLERAVGVYMEEGPISVEDITLPAGRPGCQTANYKFQEKAGKPTWKAMTEDEAPFLVIFNTRKDMSGTYNGPVKIPGRMERYVRFFDDEWYIGQSPDNLDVMTACDYGNGKDFKICILGMVLTYHPQLGYLTLTKEDFVVSNKSWPSLTHDMIDSFIAQAEWPADHIFQLKTVVGYLPCNVKWSNALRFDPSNKEGKCLHFTASSKGTVFVIFSVVPKNKDTWYYVQISPYGVGIFKSQRLMVSTVDVSATGLGADILYQSYFVCLKETSASTVIEYGKSQGTTEFGDVYLTMIDRDNPLYVRFYSFGNGEKPLEVVDAHIVSRHLTKANCRGDTVLDNVTNMCVQNCHELCDPTQGCRRTSSNKPLATDCNACRYLKNSVTGECLEKCPEGWDEMNDKTCVKRVEACDDIHCFNGGTCENIDEKTFKCVCAEEVTGEYCETRISKCKEDSCMNGGTCEELGDGTIKCNCKPGYKGPVCQIKIKACDSDPCLNGAYCTNEPEGKYSCECQSGWLGERCETEIKACDSSPCLNGGYCTNEAEGKYSCECQSGWLGERCETEIKACDLDPCFNGGHCTNEPRRKYSCQCQSGWYGERCETSYALFFPKRSTKDYVILNNAMPSLTVVTICLWMKVTDTENKGTPLSYAVPGSDNELVLYNYNGFSFEVAGSSRQTSVSANDGKWHHICATWENTAGSWKLFKDGKLGDSGTDFETGHVIPGGGALVLAQEQDSLGGKFGDTQNFIGEMTGVNIWDHVITDQEIMRMSQSCQTGVGNVFKWSDFKDHVKGSVKIIESSC